MRKGFFQGKRYLNFAHLSNVPLYAAAELAAGRGRRHAPG